MGHRAFDRRDPLPGRATGGAGQESPTVRSTLNVCTKMADMGNIAHRLKPPLENWVVDHFPSTSFRLSFCPIPFKLLGLCGSHSDSLLRFSEQSQKTLEYLCELWKELVHLKTFNS
jgi:hypothetical protein